MVSACSSQVSTTLASSVLCQHYDTYRKALEFVVLGDFDKLTPVKPNCHHGIFQGEALGDCLPESFETYTEYEDVITKFPYDNSYVFKDKAWWEINLSDNQLTYKKLKKKRKK